MRKIKILMDTDPLPAHGYTEEMCIDWDKKDALREAEEPDIENGLDGERIAEITSASQEVLDAVGFDPDIEFADGSWKEEQQKIYKGMLTDLEMEEALD